MELPDPAMIASKMLGTKSIAASLVLAAVSLAIAGGLVPAATYWVCLSAVVIAFAALVILLRSVADRLSAVQQSLEALPRQLARTLPGELHAMEIILRRFPECAIPTSSWSMRFANLHAILDILDTEQPAVVVEFGSGISTLLVAAWMGERRFGKLISFDHDPDWAAITRRHLARENLSEYGVVIDAPLGTTTDCDASGTKWYDLGDHLDTVEGIGLVIVDGPPGFTPKNRLSRLPALGRLHAQLASNCTVALDDALRPGEVEIIGRWKADFPEFRSVTVHTSTGLAILRRSVDNRPDMHTEHAPLIAGSANQS